MAILRASALRPRPPAVEARRFAGSTLHGYQRDIDQPLMGVGGGLTRGGASDRDRGGWPFLKGLVALDFPLLGVPVAHCTTNQARGCAP